MSRKTTFLRDGLDSSSIICDTDTRHNLEVLHQCGKRVKNKCQKVLGANFYVCRNDRRKTGRSLFAPPILNRVKEKPPMSHVEMQCLKRILSSKTPSSSVRRSSLVQEIYEILYRKKILKDTVMKLACDNIVVDDKIMISKSKCEVLQR